MGSGALPLATDGIPEYEQNGTYTPKACRKSGHAVDLLDTATASGVIDYALSAVCKTTRSNQWANIFCAAFCR